MPIWWLLRSKEANGSKRFAHRWVSGQSTARASFSSGVANKFVRTTCEVVPVKTRMGTVTLRVMWMTEGYTWSRRGSESLRSGSGALFRSFEKGQTRCVSGNFLDVYGESMLIVESDSSCASTSDGVIRLRFGSKKWTIVTKQTSAKSLVGGLFDCQAKKPMSEVVIDGSRCGRVLPSSGKKSGLLSGFSA
jgi:hypothetical protein